MWACHEPHLWRGGSNLLASRSPHYVRDDNLFLHLPRVLLAVLVTSFLSLLSYLLKDHVIARRVEYTAWQSTRYDNLPTDGHEAESLSPWQLVSTLAAGLARSSCHEFLVTSFLSLANYFCHYEPCWMHGVVICLLVLHLLATLVIARRVEYTAWQSTRDDNLPTDGHEAESLSPWQPWTCRKFIIPLFYSSDSESNRGKEFVLLCFAPKWINLLQVCIILCPWGVSFLSASSYFFCAVSKAFPISWYFL